MNKLYGCLSAGGATRLGRQWPGLLIAVMLMLTNSGVCLQQVQPANQRGVAATIPVAPQEPGTSDTQPNSDNVPAADAQIQIGPIGEASSGNGIQYHGGPLMLTTHNVYFIWYGNWTGNTALTLLPQFVQNLSNTPYFSINTTYDDSNNKSIGSSVGMSTQTFDSYSHSAALNDSGVLGVVSGAISRGALPVDANGIYFVLGSGDVTESGANGTFCSDFCGWHKHATLFGSDIKYAFVGNGFPQCINNPSAPKTCAFEGNQSVSPNGNPGADAMVNTISHELSETVTDPDLNAWFNSSGLEVGDICFQQFDPTFSAPNGSRANLTLGGVNYLSQTLFLNDGGGRCTMASTGNVFLYSSAHDQYYGCHGIAGGSSGDCNNITDANDRLICQAVAQHSQTPCSTPVTDRNLQLSCFGIAFAPNFPTNCRDITNPQMQAFCYGVSSGGTNGSPNCSTMADADSRALCNGMALHDSSFCSAISNANDRQFCLGVSSRSPSQCSTISSCPDPNAQASCLNNGGNWDWNACSCTFGPVCDPTQQQICMNNGGSWDPTTCTCTNPGCNPTAIICQPTAFKAPSVKPIKSQDVIQAVRSAAKRN